MLREYVKDKDTTAAQKSIKHCLNMLAPLCVSDTKNESDGKHHLEVHELKGKGLGSDTENLTDIKLQKGQKQFYEWMASIYQAMYQEPEKYMVFPGPYEQYMMERDTDKLKKGKEKEHSTDAKESTLRNTFQQAIQFYANFFYKVGLAGTGIEEQSGAWMVAKEKYVNVLREMGKIHESKYNEQRYQLLSKLGLQISQKGDFTLIVHNKYKEAMYGLQYLCKAPDQKYKYMNYLRLDYQSAYKRSPDVEDICKVLSTFGVNIIKKLEAALTGWKVMTKIKPLRGIISDFMWKVEYTEKGKSVCGFYADHDYFMLCIHFNNFQNITDFAKELREEDEDLFQWFRDQFPERLCKCPSNRRVYFAEEPRRICGLSNRAEVVNPTDDDVEKAIYVLKKYRKLEPDA